MAFKTLMKRQVRMVPSMTIRLHQLGRVIISWDLRRKIKQEYNYLEIQIDEDYNKLAFKPSNNEIRGFKLNKMNMIQVSPLRKLKIIGDFKARFTEGKIIVDDFKVTDDMKSLEYWEDTESDTNNTNNTNHTNHTNHTHKKTKKEGATK